MFENKILSRAAQTTQQYQRALETHKTFLSKFKLLPQKTRKATYKQLMMLPNNYSHLQELTKPYQVLPQHGLNKQLALVVNALSRLYPELSNQWVPSMIHPFVKLFSEDFTFSFQCSLTFLFNWLNPIIYDFPNGNKEIMEIFQQFLPLLKEKVQSLDYPLSSLINPMFVVSLTDVLNKKDWLEICDFLVTNPFQPWHFISIGMAVVESIQKRLQKLPTIEDMSLCLKKQKNLPIQMIIKRAKQISKEFKQRFLNIYNRAIFPLQQGRYPVTKFFRQQIRSTNAKLQSIQDYQMKQIKQKYKKLDGLLQSVINSNHVEDEKAIDHKYEVVEGQVRQYLNLVKKEHANKVSALRQIEAKFNAQISKQGQNRQSKLNAIEKRARLQREIQTVLAQAESIKRMEDDMMTRMKQTLKIKKNEIRKMNNGLKQK